MITHDDTALLRELIYLEQENRHLLRRILRHLNLQHYQIRITQENTMAIGNITAGSTGTFAAQLLDNGTPVATPPTFAWSASDPSVTFSTSADTTSTVVSVPAGDTGTSVTITASATAPDGSTVQGSLTVALTAAPQQFTVTVTQTA